MARRADGLCGRLEGAAGRVVEPSFAIFASVTVGLIAAIWRLLQQRIKEHKEHCDDEVRELKVEVHRLRDWRHDEVAQVLSRHELGIAVLKAKVGVEE